MITHKQRQAQARAKAREEAAERVNAVARAAHARKVAEMVKNQTRVASIVGVTAREIMQQQLDELDKDTGHFNGSKRIELVRQMRELDGVD